MSDPKSTLTQSERLAAISTAWNLVSTIFTDPALPRFRDLEFEEFRTSLMRCCSTLDPDLREEAAELLELAKDRDSVRREYAEVFGHTLAVAASPYELEYMDNQDVFAQTQHLADIQGFYRAFGLQVQKAERADHIAVESEFLSHLFFKHVMALENGQTENAEVCEKAWKDFSREHFSPWASKFGERLSQQPSARFYRTAGNFLRRLLTLDPFRES